MPETNGIDNGAMLPVGTLLQGGKYRIERYLSSGGFGNTYVATNTEFEEQVAIKEFFMRGISDRNGDSVSVSVSNKTNVQQFTSQKEKFRKEARRLRKLRNPHIVAVHDLFEENGTAYYEMDLIKGKSLSERMKRTGQPLGEAEVLQILDQVLDALSVVHAQGLYHLDLKPANIMVDQTGRALLIDFGASKQMSAGDGYSVSTSSALAFTPGYAPLEQTEQNMKAFGPWTDLYALGATLYKLLTGLTPPSASEILMMTTPLLFPTPVSGKTQQLIAWMMKPRLDERPQSVAAVRQFLTSTQPAEEKTRPVEPEPVKEKTVVIERSQPKPQPKTQPKPQPKPKPEQPVSTFVSKQPKGEKSGSNKLLWGIGGFLLMAFIVAVGGILIFFVVGGSDENPTPQTEPQEITLPAKPSKPDNRDNDDDVYMVPSTSHPTHTTTTTTTPSRPTTTAPGRTTTTTTPGRTTTTTTNGGLTPSKGQQITNPDKRDAPSNKLSTRPKPAFSSDGPRDNGSEDKPYVGFED